MTKIAILIPCYNEELTIGNVIEDFRSELPDADISVFDNNSTDESASIAKSHDAIVIPSPIQGKGAVVQHMFSTIDADKYVIVDGDGTYPAIYVKDMLSKLSECDMVLGDRLSNNYYKDNKRLFHGFGNFIVKFLVNLLYHGKITDIMTGYRAFNRDFVKNIKLTSIGFEVETEMAIYALKHHYKVASIPILYLNRPDGSKSKVKTFSDGIKILKLIFKEKFNHD